MQRYEYNFVHFTTFLILRWGSLILLNSSCNFVQDLIPNIQLITDFCRVITLLIRLKHVLGFILIQGPKKAIYTNLVTFNMLCTLTHAVHEVCCPPSYRLSSQVPSRSGPEAQR